jgi:hypothetical protein
MASTTLATSPRCPNKKNASSCSSRSKRCNATPVNPSRECWHLRSGTTCGPPTFWPMHDDQPVPVRVKQGRLVSIPYSIELNDVPVFLTNADVADFAANAKAQFDTLYREGADSGRVMCLAIHPYLMGTPQRARYLDEILEYIHRHEHVWHTTAGDIAEHFLEHSYDEFVASAAALTGEHIGHERQG